jgi:hypothetical protein
MQVTEIRNSGGAAYDPFLVDVLGIGSTKTAKKTTSENQNKQVDRSAWQKDILLNALNKLENNVQVDDKSPLNYNTAAPLSTYDDALKELRSLVDTNFKKYASQAQANLTPHDILYLFEGENSFVA